MRRKSSALISGVLLVGLLVGAIPAHAANKKKELAKQAKAAEESGDFEQAEQLYCELLQEDKKSKSAKEKCEEYTQRNQPLRAKDADAMTAGKAALAEHRFPDAIRAFQSVTGKHYKEEASHYLTSVIPDAQKAFAAEQQAKKREEEARNADTLKKGMEAYQHNDFDVAKSLLAKVAGPNATAAQHTLQDIGNYTTGYAEAFKLEKAGKYKQALERYRALLKIKADGPWEISQKAARVQQLLKSAAEAKAQAAAAPVLSPEDTGLAQGVHSFYRGEFQEAARKLATYSGDGPKKALAVFYLGACELSLYYLAPSDKAPKEMYERAVEHFRSARQLAPKFAPPEQYVSPRILKVFKETGS
jgi:hypothetical protein